MQVGGVNTLAKGKVDQLLKEKIADEFTGIRDQRKPIDGQTTQS
jgi:hypothetical protein